MKDFIVIIIIVSIIFGGSFFARRFFESSGNEIISVLDDMSYGIIKDSDEERKNKIDNLKEMWDKKQKIWITMQYHENVNNMHDTIIECCNYYFNKDEEEFVISKEKVKRSIDDLKNRETLSLFNIM